jgi:hypothetical protein
MARAAQRVFGVIAGLVAAQACDQCDEPPPPFECEPCDAVIMLRRTDGVRHGDWTVPKAADEACKGAEHPGVVDAWEKEVCWQQSANYLVHVIDWRTDEAIESGFEREADGTFACPDTAAAGSAGCGGQGPSDTPARIVGPYDVCDDERDAVAMLVDTAELASPDTDALAQNLAAMLSTTDAKPAPVFTPPAATAFLIGPRHLLTVAHWISPVPEACGGEASDRLDSRTLLFDYRTTPDTATRVTGITVVACGRERADDVEAETDWAVLELDAPLPGRTPLALPPAGSAPTQCATVYTLGHPLGHPQQCIGTAQLNRPTAWVVSDPNRGPAFDPPVARTFTTSLDVVHSLSGAPVFDRVTGSLIGMHRKGVYDLGETFRSPAAECTPLDHCGVELNLGSLRDELDAIIAD